MRTTEEVKYAFHPVPAKELTEVKKACIQKTEFAFVDLVTTLLSLVPESADRTAAFRKCMEAKFTCVQAITHHKEVITDPIKSAKPQPKKEVKKEEDDGQNEETES